MSFKNERELQYLAVQKRPEPGNKNQCPGMIKTADNENKKTAFRNPLKGPHS